MGGRETMMQWNVSQDPGGGVRSEGVKDGRTEMNV